MSTLSWSVLCLFTMLLFYAFMSLKSSSGTSICLSVIIVHCCLLTFCVILEDVRPAASASSPLCILIGSVPGLWVPDEKLL